MLVKLNDVTFYYGSTCILKGVTTEINRGEVVGIIGPNGSGKSTLLKCVARILKPKGGSIYIGEDELQQLNGKDLAKRQGYVPQTSSEVFPLTVMETVLMGRKPHIRWGIGEKDIRIVEKICKYLNIDHMAERYVNELSGGERQKVLIARALAQEPSILLLDEPTSALDIRHELDVLNVIQQLAHDQNHVVLIVLHDLEMAARYCDQLVLLKEGAIFAAGTANEVLTEENIRHVYGVEVEVTPGKYGPRILAISPA